MNAKDMIVFVITILLFLLEILGHYPIINVDGCEKQIKVIAFELSLSHEYNIKL